MQQNSNTNAFAHVFAQLANTSATVSTSTSNKKYTVGGISTLPNGETKVRLANNLRDRIGILRRNGHTNIMLMQLETAMTEKEIAAHLLTIDFGSDEFNEVVAANAAKLGVSRKVVEEEVDMTDEEAAFTELGQHS